MWTHWEWRALSWVHGLGSWVLSCLDALPGPRALVSGQHSLAGASLRQLPRVSLLHSLHVLDPQHMRNPTSSPQVLESRHLLKCPAKAPFSTCQHSEMKMETGFLRGVYSQELANPGTGSFHDLDLGSPCSPSLQHQILVPELAELPGEFELFLSESAKVTEKGKLKPSV